MKNRIWVAMDNDGEIWQYLGGQKPTADAAGRYRNSTQPVRANSFNLNLKPCEIVEIIIDTETQKYEVKRPREIGWWLTVNPGAEVNFAAARHWNGEMWKLRPREKLHCSDGDVAVVSEIIRDNEYLKSLE